MRLELNLRQMEEMEGDEEGAVEKPSVLRVKSCEIKVAMFDRCVKLSSCEIKMARFDCQITREDVPQIIHVIDHQGLNPVLGIHHDVRKPHIYLFER